MSRSKRQMSRKRPNRKLIGQRGDQLNLQYARPVRYVIGRVPFTGLPRDLDISFKYYQNNFKWELNTLNPLRRDVLSLNDPWDPYTSIGGKSAAEFYNIMQLYKYCRTKTADVTINIVQDNFASYKNVVAAMIPNYDNTNIANLDDLKSQDATMLTISELPTNVVADAIQLKRTFDISTVLGMTPYQYRNLPPGSYHDVYNSGSSIFSPTLLAKLDVYVGTLYPREESIIPVGEVTIVFHCRLTQKIYNGEAGN